MLALPGGGRQPGLRGEETPYVGGVCEALSLTGELVRRALRTSLALYRQSRRHARHFQHKVPFSAAGETGGEPTKFATFATQTYYAEAMSFSPLTTHSLLDDAVLIAQESRQTPGPCIALLHAVLEDLFAVRDARPLGDRCKARRTHAQVASDRAWLESESEAPFSFRWTCVHLGLDPAAVRHAYVSGARLRNLHTVYAPCGNVNSR